MANVEEINGIKVLAAEVSGLEATELRDMADNLRDKIVSGVVVLASVKDDNVQLIAAVTKDLAGKKMHAGNIIKEVAKICGGGGGGRPDMAQAGGKDKTKLGEAFAKVKEIVSLG